MADKLGNATSKLKGAKKASERSSKGKEALSKGASKGQEGLSQLNNDSGGFANDQSQMADIDDFQNSDTSSTSGDADSTDKSNEQSKKMEERGKEAANEVKDKAQDKAMDVGKDAYKSKFGGSGGEGAGGSGSGAGGSSSGGAGSGAGTSGSAGSTGTTGAGAGSSSAAGGSGAGAGGAGAGAGGTAAAESNPVGWIVTIIILIIIIFIAINALFSSEDYDGGAEDYDTQSYNFVSGNNDIITDDSGNISVNSIDIENKLYMTYFQYIANQGLYYTVTDLDGKTYNLEQGSSQDEVCTTDEKFDGKCKPEDKEGKDKNLELDYLQLIYLNNLLFDDYIYPQQLVKPVYNTCGSENLSDSDNSEECKTESLTNADEELVAESSTFKKVSSTAKNVWERTTETTPGLSDWGFAPIVNYQEGEEYDYWQDKKIDTVSVNNVYPMVGSKTCDSSKECAEYPVAITDGDNATITINVADGLNSKDDLANLIYNADGSGYNEDAANEYANELWNNGTISLASDAGGPDDGREADSEVTESLTTEFKYLVSSIATYMGNASNSIVETETNNGERTYGTETSNTKTYTVNEEDLPAYNIESKNVEKSYSLGEINTDKGTDDNGEPTYSDIDERVSGYDWNYTCSQNVTYTYEGKYEYDYFDEGLDSFETSSVTKTETETEEISNCNDSPSYDIGSKKNYEYKNPETGKVETVSLTLKTIDIDYTHNTNILDYEGNVIESYNNKYVTGGTVDITTTLNGDIDGSYTMYRHEIRYDDDGMSIDTIDYYIEDYANNAETLYINKDYLITVDDIKSYSDLVGELCTPEAELDMSENINKQGETNYDGLDCDALASVFETFEYDPTDPLDDAVEVEDNTGESDFEFGTNNEDSNTDLPEYAEAWDYTQVYANQFGLDPYLLWALFGQESGWRMVESAGGIGYGIGQLTLSEFSNADLKVYDQNKGGYVTIKSGTTGNNEGNSANIMTLEGNIKVSAAYLAQKLETFNYNIPVAIQSYNFGDAGVRTTIKMQISYDKTGSFDNWEDVSSKEVDKYIESGAIDWMSSGATEATSEYYGGGSTWGDPDYVENVSKFYYGDEEPYAYDKKGNQHTVSGNLVNVNKINNQSKSVEEMINSIASKDFFEGNDVSKVACTSNKASYETSRCDNYNANKADNNFEYLYGVDIDSVQTEFTTWEKIVNKDKDDSDYAEFRPTIDRDEVKLMEDILLATMQNVSLEEYQLFPMDPAFILYSFFADSGYTESYEKLIKKAIPADNISLITGDVCLATSTPMGGKEGLITAINAGEAQISSYKENIDGVYDGMDNIKKVYEDLQTAVDEGQAALDSPGTSTDEYITYSEAIYEQLDKFKDDCDSSDIIISRDFGKDSGGTYQNNVQILQKGGTIVDENGDATETKNVEAVMSLADGIALTGKSDEVILLHGYDVEDGVITPIYTKYMNVGIASTLPTLDSKEQQKIENAVLKHSNEKLKDKALRDQDITYSINTIIKWKDLKDLKLDSKLVPGGTVLGQGEMLEAGDVNSQTKVKTYNFEFYFERWGHAQDPTFIIDALNNSVLYNLGATVGSSGEESFTGIGNADISVDFDTFFEDEGCGPEWAKYKSSGTKFVFGVDCGELEEITEDDFGRPIGTYPGNDLSSQITAMATYPGGTPHASGSALGTAVDMDYAGAASGAGLKVFPVAEGKVVSNFKDSAGANGTAVIHLVCDNSGSCENYVSFYLHFKDNSFMQSEGDDVTTNDALAQEGSTGNSTGDHLHLEIAKDSLVPGWYNPGKAMPAQEIANLIGVPGGYGASWFSREK